tara:strand:- start:7783 stop:8112 length:330 start_codon:yes stop_codon:yes gene_type:complete
MEVNIIYVLSILLIIVSGIVLRQYSPQIYDFLQSNKEIKIEEPIQYKNKIFNGKSKCFDCERQINMTNNTPYNLVHPTKCFDCEAQIANNYNGRSSNIGHSSKCFTCEN